MFYNINFSIDKIRLHRDIKFLKKYNELPIEDKNNKFYEIAMKFIGLNDKSNFEYALCKIDDEYTHKHRMQIIQSKFLEAKFYDLAERVASWL